MVMIPLTSKFNFYQQVRVLLHKLRDSKSEDENLLNEKIQMSSTLSLDSPDGQVESIHQDAVDDPIRLFIWSNGLTGAMGALPIAYSEWLNERYYRYSDDSAKSFLDLFGHRLYCLDYLVWQKHHLYAQPENQLKSSLLSALSTLTGVEHARSSSVVTPFTPQIISSLRSMANLEFLLTQAYGIPVHIVPFTGGWVPVSDDECCQLNNSQCLLSSFPMIGRSRLDVSAHFNVILGPISQENAQLFYPQGDTFHSIWLYIQNYVSAVINFSISLIIKKKKHAQALGFQSLGFDLSLGNSTDSDLYQINIINPRSNERNDYGTS
ncbi:type VI secretion system baseplate subunit TssG [Providencia rettgeri]|uniref:type VI secretion system baseplate subunit TssG n=1 Tax=Providencia rettgeri TaxID=587 RepID=UPI00141A62DB|nr:type VI secretion system baseplate subunit TssG [Providencia rettgeri]NIH07162.1 type VI secretion system baseplate subunit TssG [Providencia rettgeri]